MSIFFPFLLSFLSRSSSPFSCCGWIGNPFFSFCFAFPLFWATIIILIIAAAWSGENKFLFLSLNLVGQAVNIPFQLPVFIHQHTKLLAMKHCLLSNFRFGSFNIEAPLGSSSNRWFSTIKYCSCRKTSFVCVLPKLPISPFLLPVLRPRLHLLLRCQVSREATDRASENECVAKELAGTSRAVFATVLY